MSYVSHAYFAWIFKFKMESNLVSLNLNYFPRVIIGIIRAINGHVNKSLFLYHIVALRGQFDRSIELNHKVLVLLQPIRV